MRVRSVDVWVDVALFRALPPEDLDLVSPHLVAICPPSQLSPAEARAWSSRVEESLRRARPLPPHEEMVIDDLTEEEGAAFLSALEARTPNLPAARSSSTRTSSVPTSSRGFDPQP